LITPDGAYKMLAHRGAADRRRQLRPHALRATAAPTRSITALLWRASFGWAAARRPARSEPANSQFFLPTAIGRIAFSTGLLSIGSVPESA
jgi:hypothetical protein